MPSIVQMHPDVRVSDPTFRPAPSPAYLFVSLTQHVAAWDGSRASSSPVHGHLSRSLSRETSARWHRRAWTSTSSMPCQVHARLMLQWALSRRVIYKKGCPSYDARWIEGLHQVTYLVASGKIKKAPTIAIQLLACPDQISFESMAIDF